MFHIVSVELRHPSCKADLDVKRISFGCGQGLRRRIETKGGVQSMSNGCGQGFSVLDRQATMMFALLSRNLTPLLLPVACTRISKSIRPTTVFSCGHSGSVSACEGISNKAELHFVSASCKNERYPSRLRRERCSTGIPL